MHAAMMAHPARQRRRPEQRSGQPAGTRDDIPGTSDVHDGSARVFATTEIVQHLLNSPFVP